MVVLQLQLGRAGADRGARRERRVRRVHRCRREQHHSSGQQQMDGSRRVPDGAEELARRQHDIPVSRPAQDVHAARDQIVLGHHRPDRRSAGEGQALLLLRLPVPQHSGSPGRIHRQLHEREGPAHPPQAHVGRGAQRPRRRVRRMGQVRRRGSRRQRPAADDRGHRTRAIARMELERPDYLDDQLEDDAECSERRLLGLLPRRADAAADAQRALPALRFAQQHLQRQRPVLRQVRSHPQCDRGNTHPLRRQVRRQEPRAQVRIRVRTIEDPQRIRLSGRPLLLRLRRSVYRHVVGRLRH